MASNDEFLAHEALDRTSVVLHFLQDTLLEHPYFDKPENHKLFTVLDEAADLIASVYQTIGQKHL